MAQSVMSHLLSQKGLSDMVTVDSAATSTEEVGNPPHHGTVRKLNEMNIPVIPHRARQMTRQDYASYDLLIGMDEPNLRNMLRITGSDPEHKIKKLLEFSGSSRDIADPWYTGNFDATYTDVLEGCTGLLQYIEKLL